MKSFHRIGIFLFYDPDGIADDYIFFMLKELDKNLDRLIIVVNGSLAEESQNRFLQYTDEIIRRENRGFDAGGWKFAMVDYLGWKELDQYDEILLVNDSCFGPVYPMKSVFTAMENSPADFWGLTETKLIFKDVVNADYSLESYFLLIRKRMHTSDAFKEYWNGLPEFQTFYEACAFFEPNFTKYFLDLGFRKDVYIDKSDLDWIVFTPSYRTYEADLISRGMPLIKRKTFRDLPYMSFMTYNKMNHNGEETAAVIDYLRNHTDYDVSMIYSHVIRTFNIAHVRNKFQLYYVFNPHKQAEVASGYKAVLVLKMIRQAHYSEKAEYLRDLPSFLDVIILTDDEAKTNFAEKEFRVILGERLKIFTCNGCAEHPGFLLSPVREQILQYDYFAYCEDSFLSRQPYSRFKYWDRLMWKNTLASGMYITQILKKMENDPFLGLMTVPDPVCVSGINSKWWFDSFSDLQGLLSKFTISVPIDNKTTPVGVLNAFWGKTDALLPLLEKEWDEGAFPPARVSDAEENIPYSALERSYAYVAQSRGYYAGTVYTSEYASLMMAANNDMIMNYDFYIPKALHYDGSGIRPSEEIVDGYYTGMDLIRLMLRKISRKIFHFIQRRI